MTKDEALRMALDALEHEAEIGNDDAYRKERDAIREALAQPYPDNFIDALMYDVAKRDSEAQQAYEDAIVGGTGVMLGGKRIDPASIYKEPEQEPVAWVNRSNLNSAAIERNRGGQGDTHTWSETPTWDHSVPLYTTPPQRKPLTDEEISNIWCKVSNTDFVTADTHEFARAIEAAHGIKGES